MRKMQITQALWKTPVATEQLDVLVLFTSVHATLPALTCAAKLAKGLCAQIRLLVPQIVPYPLPLEKPAVHPEVLDRRFHALIGHASVDVNVDIRLCRDPWEAIEQALPNRSIVVMGIKSHWWPTKETWLARKLRKHGHEVVVVEQN